jgi:hypothetical protein
MPRSDQLARANSELEQHEHALCRVNIRQLNRSRFESTLTLHIPFRALRQALPLLPSSCAICLFRSPQLVILFLNRSSSGFLESR